MKKNFWELYLYLQNLMMKKFNNLQTKNYFQNIKVKSKIKHYLIKSSVKIIKQIAQIMG